MINRIIIFFFFLKIFPVLDIFNLENFLMRKIKIFKNKKYIYNNINSIAIYLLLCQSKILFCLCNNVRPHYRHRSNKILHILKNNKLQFEQSNEQNENG